MLHRRRHILRRPRHAGDDAELDEFATFASERALVSPSQHFISAPVIDVDGDTAKAVTALLVTRLSADGPTVVLTGEYHDKLVRIDGRWRFAERRVVVAGRAPNA